jgi:hypothetical protein
MRRSTGSRGAWDGGNPGQERFLALIKDLDDAPGDAQLFIRWRLAEAAICGTLEHYLDKYQTLEAEEFWAGAGAFQAARSGPRGDKICRSM